MKLVDIINKVKSLFIKAEPKVETPVVELEATEPKKKVKKATKKVTK